MLSLLRSDSVKCFIYVYCIWMGSMVFSAVDASPLFFASPFTTKAPEGESDSVSVYTTSPPTLGRSVSTQPSIYQQIARNALERIVSPVVSHFILATATQSSKLVSAAPFSPPTTKRPSVVQAIKRRMKGNIETLDEEVPEEEEETTTIRNVDESKEDANPTLIKFNPSFNRGSERDKPERIVLNLNAQLPKENVASEVDDLNKNSKKDGTLSETNDTVNEVETIGDTDEDGADEFPEDSEEDDESSPEVTTPKSRGRNRNFSESGLIFVLEILGTIYTLGMGLVSTFLQSSMNMNRNQ